MTIRMPPRPPIASRSIETLLKNEKINSKKNDYEYRSGWNPSAVMGQQYRLDATEAGNLVKALGKLPKGQQIQLLKQLYARTESDASKGSVALDPAAAKVLNALAKQLGVKVSFDANQTRPMHPIG